MEELKNRLKELEAEHKQLQIDYYILARHCYLLEQRLKIKNSFNPLKRSKNEISVKD